MLEIAIVFSSNRSQWRADHIFLYTPGGRLRAVAEGTAPALSPDGTRVAFVRGRFGSERELVVVRADGGGERVLVRQPEGAQPISARHGLAWSPDATRVAFLEFGPTIGIADVETGAVVRIVDASLPSWSPDGRRLVYTVGEGAQHALVVADRDGSERRRLVTSSENALAPPRWSPSGRWIVYHGGTANVPSDLSLIAPDGTGGRRLTRDSAYERFPSWSPDGRRIAFVRPGGIHVAGADGGAVRRLTNRRGDAGPAWSPDGRRIAFTRGGHVWLMDADGRQQRALAAATTLGSALSWSPDGTRIVTSGRGSVYVVDVASGRRTQLTRSTLDLAPAWSPDGRRIVFTGYRDERYFRDPQAWGLFELTPDGTGLRKLLSGYYHNVAWSPDGTRLVFQSYGMLRRANADGTGLAHVIGDGFWQAEGWNERPSWGP